MAKGIKVKARKGLTIQFKHDTGDYRITPEGVVLPKVVALYAVNLWPEHVERA